MRSAVATGERIAHLAPCLGVDRFRSMKARQLRAILERRPLGYRVVRQAGSHRRMEAHGRPPFTFAFHDRATVSGRLVREILVNQIGLAEDEARKLI